MMLGIQVLAWKMELCCLQLQSYFFDSICIVSESESVQVFHSLYISVLLLEIQPLKGEGWDPINWFNPATIICLLHLPSQDLDFQQHMPQAEIQITTCKKVCVNKYK
jgi:hypothetical protein